MEKTKQQDRVLSMLKAGEKVTALSALRDIGTLRLSARIYSLKKEGWDIKKRMIPHVNRFGDRGSYAEYYLEKNQSSS